MLLLLLLLLAEGEGRLVRLPNLLPLISTLVRAVVVYQRVQTRFAYAFFFHLDARAGIRWKGGEDPYCAFFLSLPGRVWNVCWTTAQSLQPQLTWIKLEPFMALPSKVFTLQYISIGDVLIHRGKQATR